MRNVDQFAVYAASIFDVLYDSFPVPSWVDCDGVISKYLKFSREDEISDLRGCRETAKLYMVCATFDKRLDAGGMVESALPVIESKLHALEQEKSADKKAQVRLYEGTLQFLEVEGFIRKVEKQGYQLTSKGFVHLNKVFKDKAISSMETSFISALKSIFSKSSETTLQVASGTAVALISKMLGAS